MANDTSGKQAPTADPAIADLYTQLGRYAARLMVVHEAGRILRSESKPAELSAALLKGIAEPVFAGSGYVARLADGRLDLLATLGLSDEEAEALQKDASEAAICVRLLGGGEPRTAEQLREEPSAEAAGDEQARPAPTFGLYIPLRAERHELGVLALGPRVDNQPYSAEDCDFAVSLAAHLALALGNAELLDDKARRIEQLSVLLRISKEITSTLDLDKVLATISHMMSMVIPNRRTTVALVEQGDVEVRASSEAGFDPKQAGNDPLLGALRWAYGAGKRVNTCRSLLAGNAEAEGHDVLLPLLEARGGMKGLAILPLRDDQGVLGLLAIESDRDAPPVDREADELLTILANQTTVAIRNAELYQRVPMVGLLDSLLSKSRARGGKKRRRWIRRSVLAAIVLAGLFIPVPAWVTGDAVVRPARPIAVRAATAGIVDEVAVIEGQAVTAGTVLARLRRDKLAVQLEQAQATMQRAGAEAGGARERGDLATYRALQTEQAKLLEEVRFLETELRRTELLAPVDGVVLTPRVEQRKDERLEPGDTLLEIADLSTMEIEVAVPQGEIGEVTHGTPARLRVHAYPGRTFSGEVVRIAPRAGESNAFRVTIRVENPEGMLKPGMTGSAHVDIARRPFLSSLLRPVARYFRLKFWI